MQKGVCMRALGVCLLVLLSVSGFSQYKKAEKSLTLGLQNKLWFFAPGYDEPMVGGGITFGIDFHENILLHSSINYYYPSYVDSITRYAQPKVSDITREERVRIGRNFKLIEASSGFKFFPFHSIFDDFGLFINTGITLAYLTLDNEIRPFNSTEYELDPAIEPSENAFGVYFNPGVGFQLKVGAISISLEGGYGLLGMEFGDTSTDFKFPQNLHASLGFRYVPGKKSFLRR